MVRKKRQSWALWLSTGETLSLTPSKREHIYFLTAVEKSDLSIFSQFLPLRPSLALVSSSACWTCCGWVMSTWRRVRRGEQLLCSSLAPSPDRSNTVAKTSKPRASRRFAVAFPKPESHPAGSQGQLTEKYNRKHDVWVQYVKICSLREEICSRCGSRTNLTCFYRGTDV